ncbi:MAG: hypothetical protein ACKO1Y_00445 [Actinomycetota bacterium]
MSSSRIRLALGTAGAAVIAVTLVLLPPRLGPLPGSAPEDLVLFLARITGFVGALRIVVTGAACLAVAGRGAHSRPLRAIAERAPVGFRRLAGLAASGAAVVSLWPGPTASAIVDEPVVRAPTGAVPATAPVTLPATTAPAITSAITSATAPTTTVAPPAPRPDRPRPQPEPPRRPAPTRNPAPSESADPAPTERTVRPGEHLWGISASVLAERLGRSPTDAEIVPLWRAVIARNVSRLRSGDPSLVFPGERIIVPPPPAPGTRR